MDAFGGMKGTVMRIYIVMVLSIWFCCNGFATGMNGANSQAKHGVAVDTGFHADIIRQTIDLEHEYVNIQYCLANVGKSFKDLDMEKIGNDKGFKNFTSSITYGLIAVKFQDDYRSFEEAGKYFYLDWLEYKKCEKEWLSQKRKTPCDTFGSGPGEYSPLAYAIGQWKHAGLYSKALQHYPEYFDDTFLNQPVGLTRTERLEALLSEKKGNPELKQKYLDFMKEWEETKILAKNTRTTPKDLVMLNHLWFYSSKEAEVLKSLAYYHKYKVRFMLEKALKHKNPAVVTKARKYLKSSPKVSKHMDVTK